MRSWSIIGDDHFGHRLETVAFRKSGYPFDIICARGVEPEPMMRVPIAEVLQPKLRHETTTDELKVLEILCELGHRVLCVRTRRGRKLDNRAATARKVTKQITSRLATVPCRRVVDHGAEFAFKHHQVLWQERK